MHECLCTGKRPVYDVDVVDLGSSKHKSEADMPCCLFPGAEYRDRVNVCSTIQDDSRGKGGAEGGDLFRGDEGIRRAH